MGHRGGAPGRRAGSIVLAALFAVALAVSPPTARTALAASDPLRTAAAATYTLDPGAGRVHVAIKFTETDLKPDTSTYVYYYTAFRFALQPEATSVTVSGGSAYRITTRKRDGYTEATVQIGKALFYKQSTSFTIRYELVGGKPRSLAPTRVGAAYSTFGVWAWGDVGHSTVEVHIPAGFESRFQGDTMQVTSSATTGQILRATPADPARFYSIVTADDADAYAETRLSLSGGVEIVVQSWPEDKRWTEAVSGTLRDGMPELRELIGLDWPVAHDLDVRERYAPDLEGYAGLFITDEQRIEVSEDLDPVVIVHEASHAWFNDKLFVERWIYEGLAEEYAWRVQVAVGGEDGGAAVHPKLDDPGFADLEGWTHPRAIRDQETDDSERYGYEAAFWVMHQIVESAGVDVMRTAFATADESLTAYPGAGPAESVSTADGWRRLIDLTEPIDEPDPPAVDQALRAFVLGAGDESELDDRRTARIAYRALLERGGGWLPPWYVRRPMGEWSFDQASSRIVEAQALLAQRDRIEDAAGALDLTTNNGLRSAYEGAKDDLAGATSIAHAQLDALAALDDARVKVDAAPDLVTQIGLIGETPTAAYDVARNAFEAGDAATALELAQSASSIVGGAAAIGQQRLIVGVVSTAGVILLLVLLVVLLRRRSRRRAALAEPAPPEPYATLAADPATAEPTTALDEGGHARGDSPADP